MIVTFHLAVCFVYYVWENYISGLINNDNSSNGNSNNTDASSSHLVESRRGRDNVTNEDGTSTSTLARNEIGVKLDTSQVTESEEHIQSSVITREEDEGRNCIYNVEPKFDSYFDSVEKGPKFIPPVFIQRYMVINQILKDPSWSEHIKKVIDFGCAELSFELRYLKKLVAIQEIIAVDIDLDLLDRNICKAFPNPVDYLEPRPTPLTFKVYCGSVGHTNEALIGADAVIAIELIEHLFPGDLDSLPFTIFGYIKPKIAMFTTPNADFNVLFPNFTGFRHLDHKFEWSQQQFQDWGNNLVLRYPDYTVTFQGVGPGPAGTEHLGCCSQMATFVKMFSASSITEDELHIQDGEYTLIKESTFPYFVDKRTQEEKIRDDAFCFISRWLAIDRQIDEEDRKREIPLKLIMERVKCYNREKLKDILKKSDWEVTTNEDGYEVVLLPESENEDQDSYSEGSEKDNRPVEDENVNCDNTLTYEENWDVEENESNVTVNNPIDNYLAACCLCLPDKSEPSSSSILSIIDGENVSSTQIDYNEFNDSLVNVTSDKCSIKLGISPDDRFVLDRFRNSKTSIISEKYSDQNTKDSLPKKDSDLDLSVYETPYTNLSRTVKSDSKVLNPNVESLDHDQSNPLVGCKKALSFEFSDDCKDCDSTVVFSNSDIVPESTKNESFCCLNNVISPFDTSIYATPCCSELHKKYIPKCLSLQQINAHCSPPTSTELDFSAKGCLLNSEKNDKFSKSMEGFKSQESCDLHETCSNASRVVDSGYPDSYSEQNMDMDLTPEQFEDIETESDGNISSRSLSPLLPPAPLIPRIAENVENGDVANNNRDGEGNNVIADMEVEPLEFEAQIDEVNNEIPNLAADIVEDFLEFEARIEEDNEGVLNLAAVNQLHQLLCQEPKLSESNDESFDTTSHIVSPRLGDVDKLSSSTLSLQSCKSGGLENKTMTESTSMNINAVPENPEVTNKKSDSSIVTSTSWDHLDQSESQRYFDVQEKENNKFGNFSNSCNLEKHNSLTTVLDGCSKFSNCSLVCTMDKNNTNSSLVDEDNSIVDEFPEWLLSMDESLFNDRGDLERTDYTTEKDSLRSSWQQDPLELRSVYQSAESMSSLILEESSSFPRWLLDLDVGDIEVAGRNSTVSMWDTDSFEEILNYDVQVDARGGGDPLRDTWH